MSQSAGSLSGASVSFDTTEPVHPADYRRWSGLNPEGADGCLSAEEDMTLSPSP